MGFIEFLVHINFKMLTLYVGPVDLKTAPHQTKGSSKIQFYEAVEEKNLQTITWVLLP